MSDGLITMFDAVTTANIPNAPMAVAGYVDGAYVTAPELAERFPNAHLLTIAVSAEHDADALDVEAGDATPADIPAWYERQRARGVEKPCIYAEASAMQLSVVPLVKDGTLPRASVRLWSAHWAGEHICAPSSCGAVSIAMDSTQFTSTSYGRALDESLCAADFFGAPKSPARKQAPKVSTVPIQIENASIIVQAVVNGQPVSFVVDSGDAVGVVFNAADAQRLGLPQGAPLGVEGAGGASTVYETTADVTFDDLTYTAEPSAIDTDLQGNSLLGLPWFLAKTATTSFNWTAQQLTLTPLT